MSTKIDNNKHPPRNARYRLQKNRFYVFFIFYCRYGMKMPSKNTHMHTQTHTCTPRETNRISERTLK